MRGVLLLLVVGLLAGTVRAKCTYHVSTLLAWQRRSYPSAAVTSGFYDTRGVSRYRSRPGLHLGYDIAMPYGSPALAAWPGTVEAIVPWYGAEFGVTVRHPDGSTATYGHISPRVPVGAAVQPGTVVGTIASDHLDVKMRTANGEYFDYGSGAAVAVPMPAVPPPEPDWKPARSRLEELLAAETRRTTGVTRIPELEAEGLRRPAADPKPSRHTELTKAWQNYRKLAGRPRQGWSRRDEVREKWTQASSARRRAEALFSDGLLPQRKLNAAREEERRLRFLLDVATQL